MAARPIVLYPDPVLLKPTLEVEDVDEDVRTLARDMIETMYAAPGVGLAANQVGDSRRVCIADVSAGEKSGNLHVFVNPVIREAAGREVGEEGCLSFPDVVIDVERAFRVTVDALDLEGRPFSLTAEGLLARIIQHEIEHLDGRTFLSNLSPLKREMVKKKIKKRIQAGDWAPTTVL